MTSIEDRFNQPRSFQMALNSAAKNSPRRQTAMDDHVRHQFLARIFASPTEPWVLKGGTAILARVHDARATKDVDLMRQGGLEEAIGALRRACAVDLGDWLTFEVQTPKRMSGGQPNVDGRRINISVTLGAKALTPVKVDLVVGSFMTAEPERIDTSPPYKIEGVDLNVPMRLYPAVDHVADKICATAELHSGGTPSSRVRDLVDIVVLASTATFSLTDLQAAIRGEWLHRQLPGPPFFDPPLAWARTYGKAARDVPWLGPLQEFETASRFAEMFLSPALASEERAMNWDKASWTSQE